MISETDFENIVKEKVILPMLSYNIRHKELDSRKYKLNTLLQDLISQNLIERFVVKYLYTNDNNPDSTDCMADCYLYFNARYKK